LPAFGRWKCSVPNPIRVYAGVEICQIYYHAIEGEYDAYISGKYQNNTGIQPSLLYRDFEK
jgi:dCTP deaminase